jgi:hypothetical protein
MNEVITTIRPQLRNGRLSPRACPVESPDSPNVDLNLVNDIFDDSNAITDLRKDWSSCPPEWYKGIDLSPRDLRKLQNLSLLLRNRRIVCGYELLDRELRSKLSLHIPDGVPPTWLTVGKWTAKAIGDLLDEKIFLTHKDRPVRTVVRYFLVHLFRARVMPMCRILVMGNRVIFAQVGGLITEWLSIIKFEWNYHRSYPQFVLEYGERLHRAAAGASAGRVIRDPLSDSMLRAAYAYYRAMDAAGDPGTWILVGNLYLAAYEQHIAQLFVEKSMSFRPRSAVKHLFNPPRSNPNWHEAAADSWPMDMGLEGWTIARMVNVMAATFATRFILSFPVGISGSTPPRREKEGKILAPAYPFDKVQLSAAVDRYVHSPADSGSPAAESLKEVWSALDYAYGDADRTPVRDWRNFPYRVSYIANLFVICQSENYREIFQKPVLCEADMKEFLRGELPCRLGVRLNRKQKRLWSRQTDTIAHGKEPVG